MKLIKVLVDNFGKSVGLLEQVYPLMKERKFGVGEFIYKKEDSDNKLFLVTSGEVEILHTLSVVKIIKKDETFG